MFVDLLSSDSDLVAFLDLLPPVLDFWSVLVLEDCSLGLARSGLGLVGATPGLSVWELAPLAGRLLSVEGLDDLLWPGEGEDMAVALTTPLAGRSINTSWSPDCSRDARAPRWTSTLLCFIHAFEIACC